PRLPEALELARDIELGDGAALVEGIVDPFDGARVGDVAIAWDARVADRVAGLDRVGELLRERPGELEGAEIEPPAEAVRGAPVTELSVLRVPELVAAVHRIADGVDDDGARVELAVDRAGQLESQTRVVEFVPPEPGGADVQEQEAAE